MKFWRQTDDRSMLPIQRAQVTRRARHQERWFYLLITPWLLGLVVLYLGPLAGVLGLALVDWQMPSPPKFVGLAHFQTLVGDDLFWRTLLNSAYYTVGITPLGMAAGLGSALLLQHKRWGTGFWRAVYALPMILAGVGMTLLWAWFFHPRFGPINTVLTSWGLPAPGWLQDEQWAMPTLILIGLWSSTINFLVYLAALQDIPHTLREAAALDGAGAGATLRYVVAPLLTPATFYLSIVNVIGAFQVFTPAYLLTQGGPNYATLTLPLYVYLNAFAWHKLGYGAALAIALFLILLVFIRWQFQWSTRWLFYRGGHG